MRSRLIISAIAILAATTLRAAAQSVTAEISSTDAEIGEVLNLYVTVSNPTTATAPTPPETKDFEIEPAPNPPSHSSQTTIINGRMTSQNNYIYHYFVRPRRAGSLTLPSFVRKEGGRVFQSAPIRVHVKKGSDEAPLVIVHVTTPSKTAYVGQAVELTLELWVRKFRQSDVSLEPQTMWSLLDLASSSLGILKQADFQRPSYRDDSRTGPDGSAYGYFVFMVNAQAFPDAPGQFDFSNIRIQYNYPLLIGRDIFGRLTLERKRVVVAKPDNPPIKIQPLPTAGRPPDFNGAIGVYKMAASAVPTSVPVGDPITLTLQLRGSGPLDRLRPPKLSSVEALTKDFEVSGELLGGDVSGDVKIFTQTIRALREDITEIPPIPISFFNPDAGQYQSAFSAAIPLKVRRAERVTLSNAQPNVPAATAVFGSLSETSEGILANYTDPSAVLADQSARIGPGAMTIFVLMPSLYLLSWFLQRRSARFRDDEAYRRRSRAFQRARKSLQAAPDASHIRSAVVGYIADRCNVPAGGLTRAEAIDLLTRRGLPAPALQSVDTFLDQLELSEYSGASGGNGQFTTQAEQVLTALEQQKLR